ncbi:hypothetical protein TrRE_jg7528 [Triparma retinervis]|uniref:Plant heme peroxidase family profile domain-containing protein n=1 Tax=Triparma retinervis TaxID=2557542 RepID=A0A9W6ZP01_9STRA|nr:hypothetical protein TrRE_jg7528 [Triparma retinervis]
MPGEGSAEVFYDPDRYGDKELKIAAVNKIRQNVRDAIVAKPILAEAILRLSLADSLSYSSSSGSGGGNGCVLDWVSDHPCDSIYKEGAEALSRITLKLRKTTEISRGDVVALAGSEALESVGGVRCRVQIGRLPPPGKCVPFDFGQLLPDRGKEIDGRAVGAFVGAGLTAREAAIVAGVCGDVGLVVGTQQTRGGGEEEAYVNEMGETEFVPGTSFGGPKEIYGKLVGDRKVNNEYLKSLNLSVSAPKGSVWQDEQVRGWGIKYANGKAGIGKDAREGLEKVWGLGARFTGGKVEALLGTE